MRRKLRKVDVIKACSNLLPDMINFMYEYYSALRMSLYEFAELAIVTKALNIIDNELLMSYALDSKFIGDKDIEQYRKIARRSSNYRDRKGYLISKNKNVISRVSCGDVDMYVVDYPLATSLYDHAKHLLTCLTIYEDICPPSKDITVNCFKYNSFIGRGEEVLVATSISDGRIIIPDISINLHIPSGIEIADVFDGDSIDKRAFIENYVNQSVVMPVVIGGKVKVSSMDYVFVSAGRLLDKYIPDDENINRLAIIDNVMKMLTE